MRVVIKRIKKHSYRLCFSGKECMKKALKISHPTLQFKYEVSPIRRTLDRHCTVSRSEGLDRRLDSRSASSILRIVRWWVDSLMCHEDLEPSCRKWVTAGMPLKGGCCAWRLPLWLIPSGSWPPWDEQLFSGMPFPCSALPCLRP